MRHVLFCFCEQSLRRLCYYTCLSVILFTWGVVSQHALQVSRPTPRGCVSQHALRQTHPRGRRLLLRALRILLECILVDKDQGGNSETGGSGVSHDGPKRSHFYVVLLGNLAKLAAIDLLLRGSAPPGESWIRP